MTTDTTKAPHCPRCGGEMVRKDSIAPCWHVCCSGCDFHAAADADKRAHKSRADAVDAARRLVRAELARQALEMRAQSIHTPDSYTHLSGCMALVVEGYEHLGAHPLRLPGEEA